MRLDVRPALPGGHQSHLGGRLAHLEEHHEEGLHPHLGARLPFQWHLGAHLPPTLPPLPLKEM